MKQISLHSLKRFALIPITIVVFLVIVFSSWSYLDSQRDYTGKTESITFGTMVDESDTLIIIADEQKFFTANGLNVTIKKYDSGLAATNAIVKGEVDLAKAAEFVLVGKAFEKENISVIAAYEKSQSTFIVGRKDQGIENISDLRGKKIGLVRGTISEFYLGRFLELHGMNIKDVTLIDIRPQLLGDALSAGNVDAISSGRNPYVMKQLQGHRLVIWPAQSGQLAYNGLVSRNDWISRHPEMVKHILKALIQAEDYVIRNPSEAKTIVQKRLGYDDAYMAIVWPEHQFSLSLDQSLILAMEDEARWMINNNLTSEKKTPDFLDYIYADGLEKIKPGSVNIIR